MSGQNTQDTSERLKENGISFYKISKIIGEPESTVQNIFKRHCAYATDRIADILKKINSYLDGLEGLSDLSFNFELSLKLYRLGLDSKGFTPEEKLQLAVSYKKLTDLKNKKTENENPK